MLGGPDRLRLLQHYRLFPLIPLALIIVLLPPLFPSAYYYRVATLVFIFAIAALGLNLLMGFAGQVSLGHAGFMGVGAYAVAIGPSRLGIAPLFAFALGAVCSGVLAFVVGRPILRLKGHYLAVATLGFGVLLTIVFTNEAKWTGGPDGMPVQQMAIINWTVHRIGTWYWIVAASFLLSAAIALNLIDSPTGRALRAIHDSEPAARVLGVDVAQKKLTVFVISAIYASVAGSFFALINGYVTPDASGFLRSIELVAMVVLGGMGSIVGSFVGAAVLVILPQALTFFHEYEHAILGLTLMAVMIFLRRGIVPSLSAALAGRHK